MNRLGLTVSVLAALAAAPSWAADDEMQALIGEAKGLMQDFGGTLKAELMAAVKAGGPTNGIAVCNETAPEIAATISEASGWSVGRSSHLLRNPNNAPDDFTAAAIEDFVAREMAGEAADALVKAEIVEADGARVFHIVKAIPTGELCLTCHGGDNVPEPVVAKLAELYPHDQARGFTAGQMRGVFTLSKVLD